MKYIDKNLTIEKIKIQDIAKKFGTPVYCYSYEKLKKISIILRKVLVLFHL
jgi:diaminopimelate decarboxylase